MQSWHYVDYVILAVIGLSVLTGLFRGFVKEIIALCVWVLAIWLAATYSEAFSGWVHTYIKDKTACLAVAFVLILVGTLIVGGIFNAFLSFLLHRSGLSGTDRLLGMGFGFVRGVFIVALIMLVLKMTSAPYQEYTKQSKLYAQFDPLVAWLYSYTPEFIKHMKLFDSGDNVIEAKPDESIQHNL